MLDDRTSSDALLNRLNSKRPQLLRHWISGGIELTGWRRNCFNALVKSLDAAYYAPHASTRQREEIKQVCMGSDSAVEWAKRYLKKGFPEAQTASLPMFPLLQGWFGSGEIRSAHQVACCSGREIAWFARNFPEIQFIGSDCDADLVSFLRGHWAGISNLDFIELHMDKPLSGQARIQTDLLYASGGFHYMDFDALVRFLAGARMIACRIALSQPLDRPFDAGARQPSTPRGMLSWNHPYPRLLEETGWKQIEWREGFFAELPTLKNIATWAQAFG